MSRAFTSEEYESREVFVEPPRKVEKSPDADLVFAYSKGRDFSDPVLPYEIGMHFLIGNEGFFQSTEFAEKWLLRSCNMGYAPAILALADLYLSDTKTHGYRKPAEFVRKAADAGSAEASDRLDMEHIDDPCSRKTYHAYRFNAELGNPDAMALLAEGFEKGNFGKDKYKAAKLWYIRAVKKGRKDCAKKVLAMFYKKKIELSDEELRFLRE